MLPFLHLVLGNKAEECERGSGLGFVLFCSDLRRFRFAFVTLGV